MKDSIIQLFNDYPSAAILISIVISVMISLLGVVPSVFLTAANLTVFGFWEGILISFAGEAIGAVLAFGLYRRGFGKMAEGKWLSHPKIQRLLSAQGKEAFFLILALRFMPFFPSGAVTFIAAIGKSSLIIFMLGSTLGKIPALLFEALSMYQILNWNAAGKWLVALLAVILLIMVWRGLGNRSSSQKRQTL
ncbi:TVP38/TMEM64 family protein [Paenibacillus sp. strain BS8-2]